MRAVISLGPVPVGQKKLSFPAPQGSVLWPAASPVLRSLSI